MTDANRERIANALVILMILALCLAVWLFAPVAYGQDSDDVELARVCWLEGGWSANDCAAIYGVLARRGARAGVTWHVMAVRYTAIGDRSVRARLARQLTTGNEPTWNTADNARWHVLLGVAASALRGETADPCRGATQWGGLRIEGDRIRAERAVAAGRWVRVECDTRNAFFREVRR